MLRWVIALCTLGLASCNDASAEVSSDLEVSEVEAVEPLAPPQNTAGELAFAASEVCRSFISHDDSRTTADFVLMLENAGYASETLKMREAMNTGAAETAEFFRKSAHDANFAIVWGEDLPGCAVLLTDDSISPTIEQLREQFFERKWERSGVVGTDGRPFQEAFISDDERGNAIVAIIDEEPESDPTVRLGINVHYLGN